MASRRRRRTWRLHESQMKHIVGLRSWFVGDCKRCPDQILKDERIVKHGDGYIHARCASGADE